MVSKPLQRHYAVAPFRFLPIFFFSLFLAEPAQPQGFIFADEMYICYYFCLYLLMCSTYIQDVSMCLHSMTDVSTSVHPNNQDYSPSVIRVIIKWYYQLPNG